MPTDRRAFLAQLLAAPAAAIAAVKLAPVVFPDPPADTVKVALFSSVPRRTGSRRSLVPSELADDPDAPFVMYWSQPENPVRWDAAAAHYDAQGYARRLLELGRFKRGWR